MSRPMLRLLVDQNLPPRTARVLALRFPGTLHVRDVELASAPDDAVWHFALEHGYTVASKDSDFRELAFLSGPPPKVVWIRRGNCTTEEIEQLLEAHDAGLRQFLADADTSLLALE
jgi:predicted nuclease of predicted toxin-antitoxin system